MTKMISDNWDKIWNFQAKPDDLLIATYAKAGRFEKLALGEPNLQEGLPNFRGCVSPGLAPGKMKTRLAYQLQSPKIQKPSFYLGP